MQSDHGSQGSDSNRADQSSRQSSRRADLSIDALYAAARDEVPLGLLSDYKLSEPNHLRLAVELNLTYQQAMTGARPFQDVIAALRLYAKTFALQLPTLVAILVYDMLGSALCIQSDYKEGLSWLARAKQLCDGAAKPDITLVASVLI
jgi:hypothetical protein